MASIKHPKIANLYKKITLMPYFIYDYLNERQWLFLITENMRIFFSF
jgi:hypothetical protein